jgi:hypothetical protein
MYSKLPPPLDGQMQTAVSLLVYKASLGLTADQGCRQVSTIPRKESLAAESVVQLPNGRVETERPLLIGRGLAN